MHGHAFCMHGLSSCLLAYLGLSGPSLKVSNCVPGMTRQLARFREVKLAGVCFMHEVG